MIQTEMKELGLAVEEAVTAARSKQAPQLLSYTEPVPQSDPLSFFANASNFDGGRLFWENAAGTLILAGAGEAYILKADGNNRFEVIERQWKEMLEQAMIHNPQRKPGTGPIAFGGFSFDPAKAATSLWESFPSSKLRIPAYLLTVVDGKQYLTSNVVIMQNDRSAEIEQRLEEDKRLLLSPAVLPESPHINVKKEVEPEAWKELVSKATETIKQGEAEKIVLARELRVQFLDKANVAPVLKALTTQQTNSYIFAFESGEDCFLGATPERLVKLEDKKLLSTCLAGTAPRGTTDAEDERIGQQLLADEKNRSEHQFVVEMIKKAVSACCEQVRVPGEPVLYPLKNLQHLYTPVEAVLHDGYTILDIVKRLHPTPALGGLPNEESVAFIRNYERLDRGWYGAPIGWMDAYQNGEFAVAIRSALIQGDHASLFAGCGVVRDSDPEEEYQETNIKFTPMLSVLGGQS
ncbi:isochorismate synthase [Virgibacillus senegalensis]|uniref:isochorismate synthase n=1 Tax=Virgibacillus senegalensis TaxID=1499679 RepID=UPI00069F2D15|nr:isochorismate synthase [Virgibacillus senegalensis]